MSKRPIRWIVAFVTVAVVCVIALTHVMPAIVGISASNRKADAPTQQALPTQEPVPAEGPTAQASSQASDAQPSGKENEPTPPLSAESVGEQKGDDVAAPAGMPEGSNVEVAPTEGEQAETQQADQPDPAFVMPEGAEYESQELLVELPEDADLQTFANATAEKLGNVEVEEVTDGVVRVVLNEDVSVEKAVNEMLGEEDVYDAQPNYYYEVMSDEPASLVGDSGSSDAGADTAQSDTSATALVSESTKTDAAVQQDASAASQEEAQADSKEETKPESEDSNKEDGEENEDQAELEALAVRVNDSRAGGQWALDSIHAYDAWSYARGDRNVTVASMDLGCNVNHVDLKDNIVAPYNSYNAMHGGSTDDVTPVRGDNYNHGTHVAGIIAAVANNGQGIAGVSYNAQLMPIKVVNDKGRANTAELLKAYDYAISMKDTYNVRVINLSMGTEREIDRNDALLKKIDEAYNKGIVTVAAAGNDFASKSKQVPFTCYPSDYDKVVSVINLQQSGSGVTRSPSSNYNAPGSGAKNISAPGTGILSLATENDYKELGGTSMAAPVVSGVLALIFAANPSLSANDAVTLLYATAADLGGSAWTSEYGWGEVDAAAAAKAARDGMTGAQQAKADEVRNSSDSVTAYEVTKRIDALPEPQNMSASHASQVTSARAAYDALTQSQQGYVSNYDVLVNAEQRIAQLKDDDQVAQGLTYRAHVQHDGWQDWRSNGEVAGTTGNFWRLEALEINLANRPYSGTIQYRTHVQTYGWESGWRESGETSGTTGEFKRVEAIQIQLTDQMAQHYDIWYRAHCEHFGWLDWAKNGELAGSAGCWYRMEALQIKIQPKGSAAPGPATNPFRFAVNYRAHVAHYGWLDYVRNGDVGGTTGEFLRLEAININVKDSPYAGDIVYRAHVQEYGWMDYKTNGEMAGTTGISHRMEAIEIELTGDLGDRFDVWYRGHSQHYGWLDWAKNGETAGTTGLFYRLEAVEIQLLPKGSAPPGSTANPYYHS